MASEMQAQASLSSAISPTILSSASTIATYVWETFGMELVIFVLTLGFALLIKRTSERPLHVKPAKICTVDDMQAPARARPRQAPARKQEIAVLKPAEPSRGAPQEPQRIIDEVVEGMRDQPGPVFAARALRLHNELRIVLNSRGIRLIDAARGHSRNTPEKFFSALVQCAMHVGKPQLIESIVDDMAQQGVPRQLSFYESIMKQFASQKQYRLALNMYDRLAADGLEPSPVTYSCLISFASEVGELARAVSFFNKLACITTPSIRACMTVLRVHGKRQDFSSSVQTLRSMQSWGVPVDSLVLNVVLATGVSSDQMEAVEALLSEADRCKPAFSDIVSFNTLIKGFAQHKDVEGTKRAIGRMRARGLHPNAITFNTAMDAAVRAGNIQQAWDFFEEMKGSGLRADKFTCSILVKGLSLGPSAQRARETLALLADLGTACDAALRTMMYNVVVEACAQVHDRDALAIAFAQMRQAHVTPSPAAQRILSQMTEA